jgi:hypothetical protein
MMNNFNCFICRKMLYRIISKNSLNVSISLNELYTMVKIIMCNVTSRCKILLKIYFIYVMKNLQRILHTLRTDAYMKISINYIYIYIYYLLLIKF